MLKPLSPEIIKELCKRHQLVEPTAIAAAQASQIDTVRQIVEWGEGECTEHSVNTGTRRKNCPSCWQELKKLAEGK